MQQWSLIRALTQLTFVANALVVAVESKGLDEPHYKKAPGCLVECLGEWGISGYPRCAPEKRYREETFNVKDFVRDRKLESCFCGDSEALASIGECVYSNCRPKEILSSLEWGAKTCVAAWVLRKDIKDIVKNLKGAIRRQISWNSLERSLVYMGQNVSLTSHHYQTPHTKHRHSKPTLMSTSTTTMTQPLNSTIYQLTPTSTHTITETWTVTTCGLTAMEAKTVTNTATHTVTITPRPTTTISVQVTTITTTQLTSPPTNTTTHTTSATLVPPPAHLGVDPLTKELNGPSCLADCYNNPSLAGWFSDQRYKGDVHPECVKIYDRFEQADVSVRTWIEADQAKLTSCACTHKTWVKAMSECGLRECAFDRVAIQQAVVFGYQVCSKKGFIEFPYADGLVSSLGIRVPANITLPDRITIAANGVGGAPSFPMLNEDGDGMMFGSAAWKILPKDSILVLALLLIAGFMVVR